MCVWGWGVDEVKIPKFIWKRESWMGLGDWGWWLCDSHNTTIIRDEQIKKNNVVEMPQLPLCINLIVSIFIEYFLTWLHGLINAQFPKQIISIH